MGDSNVGFYPSAFEMLDFSDFNASADPDSRLDVSRSLRPKSTTINYIIGRLMRRTQAEGEKTNSSTTPPV